MAIKFDVSKAYDKLEWSFHDAMMRRLGFDDVWIDRVMTCVSAVSYSMLVNGQSSSIIKPSRGLRQGDPISLYL